MIAAFWTAVPDANPAIVTSEFVVLDADVKKDGLKTLEELDAVYGLPATLTTLTPSGGKHLFFRLPAGHGGVSNSVQALGAGLDVRGRNGYVLGPGALTAAGEYRFEDPNAPIADAPEWLVARLGQPKVKQGGEAVPPAPDAALERAREWLAGQAPAIQGQGGDARTYAVACGLRDQGVSREQALELIGPWNATCVPPWSAEELAAKVANAYRYAQNEAGAHAALPTDFPLIESTPETRRAAGAMRLEEFADFEAKSAGYLVKGILQRASYAELFGAPGEGKTFIALDIAYHVAAGAAWMGHKVRQGTVLYLGYEGLGGLRKRAKALRQHYGKKDIPLYIADATYNLREQTGRKALGELIATLPVKPALIVVDTFARALMGGDENSAQDVGAFNAAVAALVKKTDACVLIIHHSGKNKSAGARGSSALLGAVDTELEVDSGAVHPRKQRDVELCDPIGFRLTPLMVGMDEDGDEITSCVVEPAKATGPRARLTEQQRFGMRALEEMAKDNKPVDIVEWREKCKDFVATRQGFHKMKQGMLDRGAIVESQGFVTRRLE